MTPRRTPRCHSCHRHALRWLERRQLFICDSCGKVFDWIVVARRNPGCVDPQLELGARAPP
jgi:predicted RNA-binding Zn-ribbon protein involved in translation (DUF1610 family)